MFDPSKQVLMGWHHESNVTLAIVMLSDWIIHYKTTMQAGLPHMASIKAIIFSIIQHHNHAQNNIVKKIGSSKNQ